MLIALLAVSSAAAPAAAQGAAQGASSAKAKQAAPGKPAVKASPAQLLGQAYRAYDAGDLGAAGKALAALDDGQLQNRDYALWLRGQLALVSGDGLTAARHFAALRQESGSRYAAAISWRLADADWERGERDAAVTAYRGLLDAPRAATHADLSTVRFRIASHLADLAERASGAAAKKARRAAVAALREFILVSPRHPLAERAEARLRALGGPRAGALTATDRITRAQNLTAAHLWNEAVAELALVPESSSVSVRRQRDYWLGTTLFKMRRRYADAGKLLLGVAPHLGQDGAEAMFHGARALSRADDDERAIVWYRKVVAKYPRTEWAQEAQFLIGWLELNRGRYAESIEPLEQVLARYPRSKWVDDALWFLGLAHYLSGHWDKARTQLELLAKRGGALEAGKGQYWLARIDEREGKAQDARAGYLALIKRWPFSWYALLARARLRAAGVTVGPFGADAVVPKGPRFETSVDEDLAKDPLIRRTDELTEAGLGVEAGFELERGERAFLGRAGRGPGLAFLMDRYRKAGNFNRPWMLGVVHGGGALNGPAEGTARAWWQHAYPEAYKDLVDKYRGVGKNPVGYLHAIMRKESGFDPQTLSYADAQGLLQMIPATTQRVAEKLGLPYDPGRLYDPDFNIHTGSWYIGNLLHKFKDQIPLGAGAFNSGPRPVMRWCDQNGDRELDEFVELVSYTQTREYMKKVTENYARYRYLLLGEIYDLPLAVDKAYRKDDLTY
ncbi:MAG: transglycosylase SLT domain-containing protein [Myxococcales bacterium]|nr:transglycosylase SLT domain-containing protein [Myxococcales bacterium]